MVLHMGSSNNVSSMGWLSTFILRVFISVNLIKKCPDPYFTTQTCRIMKMKQNVKIVRCVKAWQKKASGDVSKMAAERTDLPYRENNKEMFINYE